MALFSLLDVVFLSFFNRNCHGLFHELPGMTKGKTVMPIFGGFMDFSYLRTVNPNPHNMASCKLLPYGISDFQHLRRDNLYLVDKTMFLPVMEDTAHFLFLIRPRRFGKSIFLGMLRAYYDILERDRFGQLFEGLWIADHPTSERGKFQVLYLDFSQVGGTSEELEQKFNDYFGMALDTFAEDYAEYYPEGFAERVKGYASPSVKLGYINLQAKRRGHPLYLIIDEYDNFTNTVLNEEGENIYRALTHANGFYRDVFKLFKPTFSRILMMGVSPVTMARPLLGLQHRPEHHHARGIQQDAGILRGRGEADDPLLQRFWLLRRPRRGGAHRRDEAVV